MKFKHCTVIALILMLLLSGCGAPADETTTNVEAPAVPEGMTSTLPGSDSGNSVTEVTAAPEMVEEPAETSEANSEAKATAEALVGEDVSVLYEKIGYPQSSDYASSCLGSGEDGELVYDGFVVITYREGTSETIQSVR